MNLTECPTPEMLKAYVAGKLAEDISIAIDEHLNECPDCQAMIGTVDDADDTLVAKLRGAREKDEYQQEPAYQNAVANVRALVPGGQSDGGEPEAAPDEEAILGEMGEYQLLAKLGEGGMGAVYKARQTNLDRIVALKVLRTNRMDDERAVPRFYREMRAVGRLTHPNIVQAYDAREIDGTPILAMEYVEGLDLSELVRRAGKLKIADACELIRQAAVGLQCAHEGGLVHRDIKPSNLMLTPDGTVKILDLGLALLDSGQPNGGEMTGSGQAMGTADYMAPEQAFDSHQVDIRADIYALGCTLYKLLAGRTPFSGPQYTSNMAKLMAHVQEPVPPITQHRDDIPTELVAVLDRLLAKSADDRFATPGEVAAVLAPLANDSRLPGLLASFSPKGKSVPVDSSLANTDPYHSSALVGTVSVHGKSASLAPQVDGPKRPPWRRIAIATGLLPLLFALGVVIWINRTRVEVPEGSQVAVKTDGSISVVTLTDKRETADISYQHAPMEPSTVTIQPDPDAWKIEPGEPICDGALTSKPAPVEGLVSWTVETRGSRGAVWDVASSPDGRLLASACFDGNVRILNAANGTLIRILCDHGATSIDQKAPVTTVAWSPDGRFLASGRNDGSICLWEAEAGRLLRKQSAHKGRVVSVDWSADGKRLFSAGSDKCVRVWDTTTGRLLFYDTTEEPIATMAISPDGQWLAYVNQNSICLRAADFKGSVRTLSHEQAVACLAFSTDSKLLASGDENGIICLWQADSGVRLHPQLIIEHPKEQNRSKSVAALALSPDGRQLASAGYDGNVRLWDVAIGLPVSDLPGDRDFLHDLVWTPDGKRLLAACSDGSLQSWDVATSERSKLVSGCFPQLDIGGMPIFNVFGSAWSPDGTTLAVGSHLGTPARGSCIDQLCLWRTDLGSAIVSPVGAHSKVHWSPDGKLLTCTHLNGRLKLLEGSTGKFLHQFQGSPSRLSFSPSSKLLACCDMYSDWLTIFALPSGEVVQRFELRRTMPFAFSPDGSTLAAIDRGTQGPDSPAQIVLRDVSSWQVTRSFDLPCKSSTRFMALEWSPNGRKLAAANQDKCYIVESQQGHILRTLDPRSQTFTLLWLSDNQTLIHGGTGEIEFWDTDTGEFTRPPLKGYWHPQAWVSSLALSPDQRLLAVASRWAVLVFDVATGQLHATLLPLRHDEGIPLGLSGDGCHWRTIPQAEGDVVYVALTKEGEQLTLTPAEFEQKYGWKNDPSKVTLGTPDKKKSPASSEDTTVDKPKAPPAESKP